MATAKILKRLKIISPTFILVPRKTKAAKKVYLNLNGYRNWHFVVSNNLKKAYKAIIAQRMEDAGLEPGKCTIAGPVAISYQIVYNSKRRRDKGNVLSVVQKFFLDALVELGYLPDDCDDVINQETFLKPIYDKSSEDCYVEITVSTDDK